MGIKKTMWFWRPEQLHVSADRSASILEAESCGYRLYGTGRPVGKRLFYFIPLLAVLVGFLYSCAYHEDSGCYAMNKITIDNRETLSVILDSLRDNPSELSLNRAVWSYYTRIGQYDSVVIMAMPFAEKYFAEGDSYKAMYPVTYIAQAYLFGDKYDSAKRYVDMIAAYMEGYCEKDYSLYCLSYNVLAVYAMKTDLDYTNALDYWKKALDWAKLEKDTERMAIFLSNIATIFYFREDTSGLQYAKEAYLYGKELSRPNVQISILYNLAGMYNIACNADSAMKYAISAVRQLEDKEEYHALTSMVYRTWGDVLVSFNEYKEAEKAYRKAEDWLKYASASTAICVYLSYGNLLSLQDNNEMAIDKYLKALEESDKRGNMEFYSRILSGLYNACRKVGDKDLAFDYLCKYIEVDSRVFNLKKEQEFSNLLAKYEEAKYEKALKGKELQITKSKLRIALVLSVSIIIAIFSIYSYVLYSRTKKMYSGLFDQYSKYRKKLEDISNSEQLKKDNESKCLYALFNHIETLMKEKKLYHDKELSINSLAAQVNTNTTYVSKAIKAYTSNNFAAYINTYRISEAVSILSDPNNNAPIKAVSDEIGYSNLTSFYRSFQKETGFPPSKFREEAKRRNNL